MVTGRSGHWEETGGADPRGAWLAAFKRFHILWSRGGGAQDSPRERLLSTYYVPEDRRVIPRLGGVSWVERRHQGGRRLRLLPLDGSPAVGLWRKAAEGKGTEVERRVGQSWTQPRIWGPVWGK